MTTGILVCGHGSRSQAAIDEFAVVARRLRDHFPDMQVEHGYLEFANPVLREGLDRLRLQGCNHILAVPGMLFAAMHAKNDIPSVLNTYAAVHEIEVEYGRELGVDPRMILAAGDRILAAMADADRRFGSLSPEETCLVVVGRGASDPDANGNVAKVARMLQEGMGFGWMEVCYSGVTFPLVEPCLTHAARLGYRRIVVFPYFLFTGVLVDRIYGFTREVAAQHPHIQFQSAGYLNDHPKVIETFVERVREIGRGDNLMNCTMCKYRTQVLGFEHEVGMAQESHHHHVEGQGANAPGMRVQDCPDCDDFCTGACRLRIADEGKSHTADVHVHGTDDAHHHNSHHHHHGGGNDHHHHSHDHHDHGGSHHHHHHPPYPHARHPHGPESVRYRLDGSGERISHAHQVGREGSAILPAAPVLPCETDPERIYRRSFEEIGRLCDLASLPEPLRPVAARMVHACGMDDLVADFRYSQGAAESAVDALRRGASVFCDTEMTRAGILRSHQERFHPRTTLLEEETGKLATAWGSTRSAAAVELWWPRIAGAVVVIGNAPTALFHLLARLEEGWPLPAFILGVPVGFVGAEESKRLLSENVLGVPFLTVQGRRGGSAIASAGFNALASSAFDASEAVA